MRNFSARFCIVFASVLVLSLVAGCDKAGPPPEALAAAEMPAAMEKAFSSAKPDIKDLATQFVALVKAKDYPKAFGAIQALMSKSGLSKEQLGIATRASLTLNELMQAAQAAGDQKAATTIQNYQLNK